MQSGNYLLKPLLFFLLPWLLVKSALAADTLPDSFTATYAVNKGVITLAYITRSLKSLGNGEYQFESLSKPSALARMITDGDVLERSTWRMIDNYPRPEIYYYKNTTKRKREVKLLFDWKSKKVTNIINGDPWKMELDPGVQDKLLYQLTLMLDLSRNEQKLEYQVADGGSIKVYSASIIGKKTIQTEVGKFDTVAVQRKSSSRTTTFWCAPRLDYLPIVIEHLTSSGGHLEARLIDIKGFNYTPPPKKDSDF